MICCLGGNFDNMNVVFDGLFSYFIWSGKKWGKVNIEIDVSECGGNDFCVVIVVVLFYFSD